MPVIFEIDFQGNSGLFELTDDVTAYPGEDEILVQDGLEYLIVSNEEVIVAEPEEDKDGGKKKNYRLIRLKYM